MDQLLVSEMTAIVNCCITSLSKLKWGETYLRLYSEDLSEILFIYQQYVDDLISILENIDFEVKSLETCLYSRATFMKVLSHIQRHVDNLSQCQCSNVRKLSELGHEHSNLLQRVRRLNKEVQHSDLLQWVRRLNKEVMFFFVTAVFQAQDVG